jgi:hypothetical protein
MPAPGKNVRVVAQITINASPSEVFKYMVNLKHHFLWNPHLRTISPIILLKEGSSYESSSIVLGVKVKGLNKVTRLVASQELQLENRTGLIHYVVNYKLRNQSGQTKLTCTTTVDTLYKPLRFADSIMKVLARRELQSDLAALKVAAEHKIK